MLNRKELGDGSRCYTNNCGECALYLSSGDCHKLLAETALELLDENERLKRQLEKIIEALDGIDGCPQNVGLPQFDCTSDPCMMNAKCSDCWRKALEEVK